MGFTASGATRLSEPSSVVSFAVLGTGTSPIVREADVLQLDIEMDPAVCMEMQDGMHKL